MPDSFERMQTLETIARKLVQTAAEANKLAFNLMELEDASIDVAGQIQGLRNRVIQGIDMTRNDLITLLAHLRHWREHERQISNVIDRAIDRLFPIDPEAH